MPEFVPHDRTYGYLLGVARTDFERVNGYDMRFVGWGEEDVDIAVRLRRIGLRCGHAGPRRHADPSLARIGDPGGAAELASAAGRPSEAIGSRRSKVSASSPERDRRRERRRRLAVAACRTLRVRRAYGRDASRRERRRARDPGRPRIQRMAPASSRRGRARRRPSSSRSRSGIGINPVRTRRESEMEAEAVLVGPLDVAVELERDVEDASRERVPGKPDAPSRRVCAARQTRASRRACRRRRDRSGPAVRAGRRPGRTSARARAASRRERGRLPG